MTDDHGALRASGTRCCCCWFMRDWSGLVSNSLPNGPNVNCLMINTFETIYMTNVSPDKNALLLLMCIQLVLGVNSYLLIVNVINDGLEWEQCHTLLILNVQATVYTPAFCSHDHLHLF